MVYSVAGHVTHTVEMIDIVIAHRFLLSRSVLLNVCLRVREVRGTGRVAAADRALDEVTLQDI